MIVDLIRWVRDVESDAVTGINAQLPNVPRDGGESAPDPVTIFNEIDDDWVGRGQLPRALLVDVDKNATPILLIRTHPDPAGFRVQALPEYEKADPTILPVVLIFARRKIETESTTITVASQVRDAKQTIRAAMRVLAQQFESSNTAFTRNSCTITLPTTGFILNNTDLVEPTDDLVFETLIASFRVQDAWALAVTNP